MPFNRKALAAVWLVVLSVFALSGSGAMAGRNALWLVAVALLAPAIILALAAKPRRSLVRAPIDGPALPTTDSDDLLRLGRDER